MRNVEISQMTLSAIKSLLFKSNDGIDVSPIVEDLYIRDEEKDLLAINVALVMKGAKPEIDMSSRFVHYSDNRLRRYIPKHYSLINNTITCETCYMELDKDGVWNYSEPYNDTMNAERFFNLSTDFCKIADRCKKHIQDAE